MKVYNELLQNKLESIMSTISEIELNLRCCGNCIFLVNGGCLKGNHSQYMSVKPFRYCIDWENDGLTHNERLMENVNYSK